MEVAAGRERMVDSVASTAAAPQMALPALVSRVVSRSMPSTRVPMR